MTQHLTGTSEVPQNLTDRVRARVDIARLIVRRRLDANHSKSEQDRPASPAGVDSLSLDEIRESQSLRRVFRDMGVSYRRYRSQTGNRVVPGLRDAAYNFRAEPTLTSLVAVAAFMDELDLLS
jgi:hypothetical protein